MTTKWRATRLRRRAVVGLAHGQHQIERFISDSTALRDPP
jgi:hypothetical protein